MKRESAGCDDGRLCLLLTAAEGTAEFQAAAEHLEACPACQSRLGALAADDDVWTDIRVSLTTSAADEQYDRERAARTAQQDDRSTSWSDKLARQILSPASHPEMLGRLGRYEIERLIGAGGMGVVFKGFDTELNRPVAIKALAPHLAGSGAARKRFAREARAAAAIVHEHVVAIHNVESDAEPPFLVMQFVAGESLQTRLDREGPLSLCEVLRIGRQTALALAAAHEQGLVHRDVKPANILLEHGVDRVLLTDFGLARASDDAALTHSGHLAGTPHFMSPEQVCGDVLDPRGDLFSLGSVLYAMCTGRPPFRAESSFGVLRRITDSEPRPLRQINSEIPKWLCRLIERLHAKQAADRYADAAEVAELLGQCLAHVQQPEAHGLPEELTWEDSPTSQQKSTSVGRWRRLVAATAFATLLIAGCIIAAIVAAHLNRSSDGRFEPNLPSTAGDTAAASGSPRPAPTDDVSTRWNDDIGASLDEVERSIQSLDEDTQSLFTSPPNSSDE